MKNGILTLLFAILSVVVCTAQALQDTLVLLEHYAALSDSCFEIANYPCTASNADLFLQYEPNSNLMNYQAAQAFAQTGEYNKAVHYLEITIELNLNYGFRQFSRDIEEDSLLSPLHSLEDYQTALSSLKAKEEEFRKQDEAEIALGRANQKSIEKENDRTGFIASLQKLPIEQAYRQLKKFNDYQQLPDTKGYIRFWYTYQDTVEIPFIVKLPQNYNPEKTYPMIIAMHGGVWATKTLPEKADSNIFYSTSRHLLEALEKEEVIAMAPYGNSKLNWLYPREGFYILPELVRYLKLYLNIDDNKICLTGHSNGGAGSFNYLMKAPSLFAGFYGLNPRPKVYKTGTFLPNALNRHFYSMTTDQDYYFPPSGITAIQSLADSLGIEWFTDLYEGFPHWFPYFDEAKPGVEKMLENMRTRNRNPFSNEIYWECDNIQNGRCDWLEIIALDTLSKAADWHQSYNFPVGPWVDVDDPEKLIDTTIMAFDNPFRSGAVKVNFEDNQFTIESSRVKSVRLYLAPEMIDFSKPIIVVQNGKKIFEEQLDWNREWMLENFKKEFDRKALWVNYLDINLK